MSIRILTGSEAKSELDRFEREGVPEELLQAADAAATRVENRLKGESVARRLLEVKEAAIGEVIEIAGDASFYSSEHERALTGDEFVMSLTSMTLGISPL